MSGPAWPVRDLCCCLGPGLARWVCGVRLVRGTGQNGAEQVHRFDALGGGTFRAGGCSEPCRWTWPPSCGRSTRWWSASPGCWPGRRFVFDVFYLTAGAGLALAALYTVPLLAGLVACLIAAADDLGLDRPVLSWTVAATMAFGLANIAVVATVGAMLRTGPSDWRHGAEAILLSAATVSCFAVIAVVMGNLAHSLGIEVKTRFPEKRRTPEVVRGPAPRPTAPAANGPAPYKPAHSKPARSKPALATPERVKPVRQIEEPTKPYRFELPVPRLVDLTEPRPVVLSAGGTGHADRRTPRNLRGLAIPSSRRHLRPGRPPGPGVTAPAATKVRASVGACRGRSSHALSRRKPDMIDPATAPP